MAAPKNSEKDPLDGLPKELQHLIQGGVEPETEETVAESAQGPEPPDPIPPTQDPTSDSPGTSAPSAAKFEGPEGFSLFTTMMKELVMAMKESSLSPASMKEILLDTGKVNAELAKKAKWPENPTHRNESVFFTAEDHEKYGSLENKPKLSRDTYFCGTKEEDERLTPAEIEAYNTLLKPAECRGGAWRAEIIKSKSVGAKDVLHVYVPKDSVDQRMVLPSLLLILHELNGGPSTENVYQLMKQLEAMKSLLVSKGMTADSLEKHLAGVS